MRHKPGKETLFYRSKVGSVFMYEASPQRLAYSPDGKTFHELRICHENDADLGLDEVEFEDLEAGYRGVLGHLGDERCLFDLAPRIDFWLDDDPPAEVELELLTGESRYEETHRCPMWLIRLAGDHYLYVSRGKIFTHEGMRLFLGSQDRLESVPITKREQYLDGGTFHVHTDRGTLRQFAVWKHGHNADYWSGEWCYDDDDEVSFTRLDPLMFLIIEHDDYVELIARR